ncbi:MAG: serine hydrolase [Pyrinomonadaceae bacterium]
MRLIARLLVLVLVMTFLSAALRNGLGEAQQTNVRSLRLKTGASGREVVRSLEKTIPRLMKAGDVPGLSIVLIRNAKIYWHRGFGVKNADTNAPMDDSTVFETASLTKPVLAYGVLKLVDSGKLELDKPLIEYLPTPYIKGDPKANLITARMVLSHTSGLQNELHPGEQLQIHFTPGERFSYSGEGYIYLQKVVEQITGERIDVFMKKAVFDPLGMSSASYSWRNEYERLMANGHNPAGLVADRIKPTEVKISWLHMTALDYARFVIAVMNGVGLNSTTAKLMLTPQVHINESCIFCLTAGNEKISPSLSWGLGWGLERTEAGEAFFHWGENRAEFHTFAMAYPKQKIGVVVFTNSGNGLSIMPEIVSTALDGTHPAFAWMGYDLYNSPKKIQYRAYIKPIRILFKDILLRGEKVITQYRNVRENSSGNARLDESQMNQLGYWLLGKKRVKEAIEILAMNVEDYPKSANAYDSLGEAYMIAGNKDLAIKQYRKSLELNPNNTNAVEMIKRLQSK